MLDQLFNYHEQSVRVCGDADHPLFVAKDVCKILGLSDVSKATKGFDADELIRTMIVSGGQRRAHSAVTESGLYALIFKSRKAEAKQFRKWVTAEVLPQIRKSGAYQVQPSQYSNEELVANPDLLIRLATQVKESEAKALHAERRAEALAPVAQFGQELLDTEDLFTITQCAKPLGTGAVTMNRFLHECGIIWRHKDEWWPMHKYQNSGHFRVIAHKRSYEDSLTGQQVNKVYHQLKVTAKGRELIHRKWRESSHNAPYESRAALVRTD